METCASMKEMKVLLMTKNAANRGLRQMMKIHLKLTDYMD